MAIILPGKLVYLATPHCGSRSTRRALATIPGAVEIHPPHTPWTMLHEHEALEGNETRVSTIRNPYDLIATWYLQNGTSKHLKTFVLTHPFKSHGHERKGLLYPHLLHTDEFLHHENLESELNDVLAKHDLEPVTLERLGYTANRKPWQTYYDEETLEAVNARFGPQFGEHYPLLGAVASEEEPAPEEAAP
jgi:hypothetical protein